MWVGIAVALILFAYTIPLIDMLNTTVTSPGYVTW